MSVFSEIMFRKRDIPDSVSPVPVEDHIKRITKKDGGVEYRNVKGKLHREDGPAVIQADGTEIWYWQGKMHREDGGPTMLLCDGTIYYHCHNVRHREDGPSVIIPGKLEAWYQNGVVHRVDGPAFVYYNHNGSIRKVEWWLENKLYHSQESFEAALSTFE